MTVYNAIIAKLDAAGVLFERHEHVAVRTSQEASAIRGTRMEEGAKALVLAERGENRRYILAVLAADRQVDIGKLRQHLGAKKLTLASPEEVLEVTGCEVGGVPPFGSCLATPLQTFCDPSLGANTRITFNAGLRTHSLTMAYADWERVERPIIVSFVRMV